MCGLLRFLDTGVNCEDPPRSFLPYFFGKGTSGQVGEARHECSAILTETSYAFTFVTTIINSITTL